MSLFLTENYVLFVVCFLYFPLSNIFGTEKDTSCKKKLISGKLQSFSGYFRLILVFMWDFSMGLGTRYFVV